MGSWEGFFFSFTLTCHEEHEHVPCDLLVRERRSAHSVRIGAFRFARVGFEQSGQEVALEPVLVMRVGGDSFLFRAGELVDVGCEFHVRVESGLPGRALEQPFGEQQDVGKEHDHLEDGVDQGQAMAGRHRFFVVGPVELFPESGASHDVHAQEVNVGLH